MLGNQVVKHEAPEKRELMHYIPKVDMWEDDETVRLSAVLPGVKIEDIDITLENNELRIYGKAADAAPEGMKLVYSEYEPGDYERIFKLSDKIERDGIEAKMNDGMLNVILPKAKEARPVRIEVKA